MIGRAALSLFAGLLMAESGSGQERLPVQNLPPTGAMYDRLDLRDPYRTTISGLFRQEVEFGGRQERIHVYIGAENRQSEPFVMVLLDKNEDAGAFLSRSGWRDIADRQGLIVALVQPPGEAWRPDADLPFLSEVYDQTHDRAHYNAQKGNNYLAAYGAAATTGQMWAMRQPENFASFASFGKIQPIDRGFMKDAAAQPTELPEVAVGDLPMPVWFFVPEMTSDVEAVLAYWNERNDVTGERLSSDAATGIFRARDNTNDSLINEQNFLAQTRYTVTDRADAADPKRTEEVWRFLSSVVRPVGFANNALRPARSLEDWGATRRFADVGGVTRYWVEYVPEKRFPTDGDKVPLVVYMHGNNNTAESMLARSEFIKVAKERGFIAVLLTGALYHSDKTFPNPKWNLLESPEEFDDYAYVRAVVEDAKKRLPVDASRIYAMGQSYGSMAVLAMSLRMNDVFAAGAGTGAFLIDSKANPLVGDMTGLYDSPKALNRNRMPINILIGEKDKIGEGDLGGVWENRRMREQMPRWLKRNGLESDVEKALTGRYKSGRFNIYEFANSDGVPLVQYSTVDQRIHTIVAMDLYFQYDTFVSKWCRDPDGTLRYMGKPVK